MQMSPGISWDLGTDGVNSGGNGLCCTSADLLKLGLLHLNGGSWNGRQLLSRDWIAAATAIQVRDVVLGVFDGLNYLGPDEQGDGAPAERREGYGFQWWRGPHNSFSANGLFGQYCIVLPDQDVAIAFTGGLSDSDHRVHDLIFDGLLPALGSGRNTGAVGDSLAQRLSGQRLSTQPGPDTRAYALTTWAGCYSPVANDQKVQEIRLSESGHGIVFELVDDRGMHRIAAGFGGWIESVTRMTGARLHHSYEPEDGLRVLACARWLRNSEGWQCLEMDWVFIETAFRDTVRCWFRGDELRVTRQVNVNSTELELPDLLARCIG